MKTAQFRRFIETAAIAFFAGAVSCALTAILFFPDPLPPIPHAELSAPQQGEVENTVKSLARVESSVSSLLTALTNQGLGREPVGDSSIDETLAEILGRLEAIDLDGAMHTKDVDGEGWTNLIDTSLARCLVENGKTPYDEGVAPLLKQATRELTAIDDEFSESRRVLNARNEQLLKDAVARAGGQLDMWSPPQEERLALNDAHMARREIVLAQFRQSIAALDS